MLLGSFSWGDLDHFSIDFLILIRILLATCIEGLLASFKSLREAKGGAVYIGVRLGGTSKAAP